MRGGTEGVGVWGEAGGGQQVAPARMDSSGVCISGDGAPRLQNWVTATGRAPGSHIEDPVSLRGPPSFWFPLRAPWGCHVTSLSFRCLLSDMEQLDWLPPSSKTPGFCYKGDGVTAEFSGRAKYGGENSPPRPGLGGSL